MEEHTKTETVFRDYIRVLFRYKFIIFICSIVLIPYVYMNQEMVTPAYTANVKILVSGVKQTDADFYKDLGTGGRFISLTQIELVKSRVVIERVVNALNLYERPLDFDEMQNATRLRKNVLKQNIEELELRLQEITPEKRREVLFARAVEKLTGSVSASKVEDTTLFIITVKDFNPSAAVTIANSVSRSYIIFDLEQKVAELKLKYGEKHSSVIQLQNHIEDMVETLDGRPLPDIEAMGPASVKVIGQAKISGVTGTENKRTGLILAFLVGLFGGISLAFILDYFSQTFRVPNDIEKHLDIPFLGSIPKRKPKDKLLVNNSNPGNKLIRYYQNICNHLELSIKNKGVRSIVISDAEASEDTITVIANIGYYLANQIKNCKVLIIDANLRAPSISKVFDKTDMPGLADVLEGKILFENAVQDVGFNLNILSAGQPQNSDAVFLDSTMMSDIIKKAKDDYEIVLIASADLKNFTDAVKLSSFADAFVIVINEGKVRRFTVKMAISQLEQKKICLLGAILNNRRMVIPKVIYERI